MSKLYVKYSTGIKGIVDIFVQQLVKGKGVLESNWCYMEVIITNFVFIGTVDCGG